jgi:hypothetical protein
LIPCALLHREAAFGFQAQAPAGPDSCALSAIGRHLSNIRSALEWSFSDRGDVRLGVALAAAAAPVFLEMSLLTECRRWTEMALAAHTVADAGPRGEMELQAAFGLSLIHTEGNGDKVVGALRRALDLAEGLRELRPQFRLIGSLHMFQFRIGDYLGAIRLAERALDVARVIGDPAGLAMAEGMLGMSHHLAGDQTRALIHCQGALQHPNADARTHVVRLGIDYQICTVCTLSRVQWLCGQADEAVDTARCALAEAEALGHPATLCIALLTAATLFLWIGSLSEVEAIVERVVSVAKKDSLGPQHCGALGLRGSLAVRRGEVAAAIPQLSDCLHILRSGQQGMETSMFTSDLAEAMAMAGRIDDALATIDGAISEAEGRGGYFDLPEMLRLKGEFLTKTDTQRSRGGALLSQIA